MTPLTASFWLLPALLSVSITQAADVKGSQDHPLITRYPGSEIGKYEQSNYVEISIPYEKDGSKVKSFSAKGKRTCIWYKGPADKSPLEVYYNYRKALERAGAKFFPEITGYPPVYLLGCQMEIPVSSDSKYSVAELKRGGQTTYVMIASSSYYGMKGAAAGVVILESSGFESDLVRVNAKYLFEQIQAQGSVSVYGIYFDVDSDRIKPDSKATVDEILKLLKTNPTLSLYVVGHTDMRGKLEHNMDLSSRRARSVVQALVSDGIAASRLVSQGIGPLSPKASNRGEKGLAQNRRVELVEKID